MNELKRKRRFGFALAMDFVVPLSVDDCINRLPQRSAWSTGERGLEVRFTYRGSNTYRYEVVKRGILLDLLVAGHFRPLNESKTHVTGRIYPTAFSFMLLWPLLLVVLGIVLNGGLWVVLACVAAVGVYAYYAYRRAVALVRAVEAALTT